MQISFAALSCSNLAALSCSNLAALSCSNLAAPSCSNLVALSCSNLAALSCSNLAALCVQKRVCRPSYRLFLMGAPEPPEKCEKHFANKKYMYLITVTQTVMILTNRYN